MKIIILAISSLIFFQSSVLGVNAASYGCSSSDGTLTVSASPDPWIMSNSGTLTFTVTNASGFNNNERYYINIPGVGATNRFNGIQLNGSTSQFTISINYMDFSEGSQLELRRVETFGDTTLCSLGNLGVRRPDSSCTMTPNPDQIDINTSPISITISGLSTELSQENGAHGTYRLYVDGTESLASIIVPPGNGDVVWGGYGFTPTEGIHNFKIVDSHRGNADVCSLRLRVCATLPCESVIEQGLEFTVPTFDLCKTLTGSARTACDNCVGQAGNETGVWTGLGCIRFTPQEFMEDFIKIALGVAGGIALLLMIFGSFQISTSAGDPKKAEAGKEIITGTIAGLLFIIFSVFLLKLIGVDILQIPGF